MAFMVPVAEYLTMYHVDTLESGTEYLPEEVCGNLDLDAALDDVTQWSEAAVATLIPYLEGSTVVSLEEHTGWYGRLGVGYLDCTEWDGPYASEQEALDAVKEAYGVDDNGDETDGVATWRST